MLFMVMSKLYQGQRAADSFNDANASSLLNERAGAEIIYK